MDTYFFLIFSILIFSILIFSFNLSKQNSLLDKLKDLEKNTDYGNTKGSGLESDALRVTVASDSTGSLNVNQKEGYPLYISRGEDPNRETLYKFGFNSDVNATEESIWDVGGDYNWTSTTYTAYVVSSSSDDTNSSGIGAWKISITGLDENYNLQTATGIELNGTNEVTVSNYTWRRIFRAIVTEAGIEGENKGNIIIKNASDGGSGTYQAQITTGKNQTLMAIYTVPNGYDLYLDDITVTSAITTGNTYGTFRFLTRETGSNKVFQTKLQNVIQSNKVVYKFEYPLKITSKTDIDTKFISTGSNNPVSCTFQGILVKTS